jgi:beta-lactamase regulating signal transducer with metallopeptidase domain
MRFYLLLILVPGAAFAFGGLSTAGVLASVWPLVERRTTKISAAARARLLALLRLAPAGAGVLAAVLVTDALVRFEPRDTTEAPGIMLWFGAMLTLVLFALAGRRSVRAVRAAVNCLRLLREGARLVVRPDGTQLWVLDSQYPVAAIVGVFRTRLLLSRRVLNECTEPELDAILSHERAHVLRRDNVVRAAMLYFPDPSQPFTAGRAIERAWAAAAEEAADDAAAGTGAERRTVLASALVRVAKMATSPMPEWIGGLAFYAGTNLESRVRRLLGTGSAPSRFGTIYGFAFLSAVSAGALLMTETAALQLHNWMELAVRVIP